LAGRSDPSSGGSSDALSSAYDRYAARLYGYLVTMTGSREAAEDTLQEVFCRLASRGAFFEVRDPEGYLFRAARNEARRWIRRRRRAETTSDSPEPEAPRAKDDAQDVRDAIRTLPSEQAEVVYLKVYEGFTFEEIGGLLGCSINTAASRWRYACEKLRARLKERMDE
jgi:RNA polymerase sigma-70 factor (ECF subfamily)